MTVLPEIMKKHCNIENNISELCVPVVGFGPDFYGFPAEDKLIRHYPFLKSLHFDVFYYLLSYQFYGLRFLYPC